jgi:hypothetical protein
MTSSSKWQEVAKLGMPEQIGCPDVRPLGPTLAQLLKAPNLTQAALARFLAIAKSDYESFGRVRDEYQGDCNIPIPVEVIALSGEKLVASCLRQRTGRRHSRRDAIGADRLSAEMHKNLPRR